MFLTLFFLVKQTKKKSNSEQGLVVETLCVVLTFMLDDTLVDQTTRERVCDCVKSALSANRQLLSVEAVAMSLRATIVALSTHRRWEARDTSLSLSAAVCSSAELRDRLSPAWTDLLHDVCTRLTSDTQQYVRALALKALPMLVNDTHLVQYTVVGAALGDSEAYVRRAACHAVADLLDSSTTTERCLFAIKQLELNHARFVIFRNQFL